MDADVQPLAAIKKMALSRFDEKQRFTAKQKHKKTQHKKRGREVALTSSTAGRSSRSPGLKEEEEEEEEAAAGVFTAVCERSQCASCLGGGAPHHEIRRPRAAGIMFVERMRGAA